MVDFHEDSQLDFGKQLDDIAANAAEASRTIEVDVTQCLKLTINCQLTYNAATALTLTAYGATDDNKTYSQINSESVSSGVGTNYNYYKTKTTSGADTEIVGDYSCGGFKWMKIIVAATGGGASDKLDAWVMGVLEPS